MQNPIFTPSQLVDVVNGAFDLIGMVRVQGEISDYRVVHNKWITFSLKDEESTVPCFMTVWQMRGQVEDGMLVQVVGKARLRNKGFFSFVVEQVRPAGEGALKRAFELLKQKLEVEGLFAQNRKRSLPRFPQHIALITSREAAAYSDFLKVTQARQGGLVISFIHTQVQGEDAPRQIVAALELANTELADLDAIVLVRGGGSLEDLHAFNDELVVRAVAASRTPTIVGIGHERDVSLAELAADVRASTPSNAAELLVESREALLGSVEYLRSRVLGRMREALTSHEREVTRAAHVLGSRVGSTMRQVALFIQALGGIGHRLRRDIQQHRLRISEHQKDLVLHYIRAKEIYGDSLSQLERVLMSLSPEAVLRRGYSITRQKDGSLVKTVQDVTIGEVLVTQVANGEVRSRVDE